MRPTRNNRMFRFLSLCLLLCVSFALVVHPSWAQQSPQTPAKAPPPAPGKTSRPRHRTSTVAPRRNAQISKIVSEIDARNIENTIRKLVSFGTRNTLSDQNNPNRGIGAARDWLYGEFIRAAQRSGGRMTVEKQTFEQPKAVRVPQPTMLTNIVVCQSNLCCQRSL